MSTARPCPKCRIPYFKGTDFCGECGASLVWDDDAPPAAELEPQAEDSRAAPSARPAIRASAPLLSGGEASDRLEVTIIDIQMPFRSMVNFMVKWTLASIPAAIILMILGAVALSTLGSMLRGFLGGLG